VNDVNETRYLPGSGSPAGSAEPTYNSSDSSTYAFKVVTDGDKVCAVKIELTSAVNSSKFSKFEITAKYWTGAAWADETLYSAATGSTTKSYIDGLTSGDAGYIHQGLSTTRYYLIKVTYSYDLVDETTQVTVTFQYTPLPQDSF
jgi:predicted peptidase